jgi:hypothetical protein
MQQKTNKKTSSMKKLLLLAAMTGVFQLSQAQKLDKVKTAMLLNQVENARTEIEKVSGDPKAQTNPEYWYWRSRIYAALYKDDAMSAKYPDAFKIADEASKKYLQTDKELKLVKDNNAQGFFDLYSTSFGKGIQKFNEKAWDGAVGYFKTAVEYSDLIFTNKWSSVAMPFDTTSILYAGYSAQNAKKEDIATKYYQRLIDQNVTQLSDQSLMDIYVYVIVTYLNNKDNEKFNAVLKVSREKFPKEDWDEYEVEYLLKNYNLEERLGIFEKEDAAGTLSEKKYLLFGDMFYNLTKEEKEKMDSLTIDKYKHKAAEAFKKAFDKNNQNGSAAFNVGVIHYNDFGVWDDRFRANIKQLQEINANKKVEKDPKKKAAVEAEIKAKTDPIRKANADIEKLLEQEVNIAIEWLEKAYTVFKDKANRTKTENSIGNKSVDFLSNLYGFKRDKARGKDQKAFDAYEAKYKLYDGLHDSFH